MKLPKKITPCPISKINKIYFSNSENIELLKGAEIPDEIKDQPKFSYNEAILLMEKLPIIFPEYFRNKSG